MRKLQDRSTDFELLPIDVDLARCLRYYEILMSNTGLDGNRQVAAAYSTSDTNFTILYKVTKRTNPTVTVSGGQVFTGVWNSLTSVSVHGADTVCTSINASLTSSYTAKQALFVRDIVATASAEL